MPRVKLWTSRKWLYKKFIVERLTQKEIAELAGTTQATINRWLKRYELTQRVQ